MTEKAKINIYDYGAFELNDKGEIICNLDGMDIAPIHIKRYPENGSESNCMDPIGVVHLLNELADTNPNVHEIEYLHSLLFKCYNKREELKKENNTVNQLQDICNKYNIPFQDLPEVLEEYIATDNEEYLEKLRSQG